MIEMHDMASLVKSIANRYGMTKHIRDEILKRYGVMYLGMNYYRCENRDSKWYRTTVKLIPKEL